MTLTDTQLAEIRERVGRGESISERDHARLIADRFLDVPYADPDGDECVLSRQFNRAVEFIAFLESQLSTIRKEDMNVVQLRACIEIEVARERARCAHIVDMMIDDPPHRVAATIRDGQSAPADPLGAALTALYHGEINCGLQSQWDGGWSVWIGDPWNGIQESMAFSDEGWEGIAAEWLLVTSGIAQAIRAPTGDEGK